MQIVNNDTANLSISEHVSGIYPPGGIRSRYSCVTCLSGAVSAITDLLALPSAERESSLHVTNTTYNGLQEHRIIVYTATGQKAKQLVHLSTESTVTGNSAVPLQSYTGTAPP
jgi:hypothetical protein